MRHFVPRFIAVLCLYGTALSLMGPLPTVAAPQSAPKLNLKKTAEMALGNHPLLQAVYYDAQAASQIIWRLNIPPNSKNPRSIHP